MLNLCDQVTSAPLTSAASAEDLLRVPEALQRGEDLPWKRVFGQALAAVAPPDSPAAPRVLLSIAPGTEKSALVNTLLVEVSSWL